jgi:uncharacterized protein (TIGR03437 family)
MAASPQSIITTLAGTDFQFRGHLRPALAADLGEIRGIAADPDGDILVTDSVNHLIARIDREGILRVIAGTGIPAHTGERGLAANASIASPLALATAPDGSLYFLGGGRIRRIDRAGRLDTIAGGGSSSQEGVPALQYRFSNPGGLAIGRDGGVYFSETASGAFGIPRVLRIGDDGIVRRFAGGGSALGDGGPALQARLGTNCRGLTFDNRGNLYIATGDDNRVRRVAPDSVITTFAGGGDLPPDGVLRTAARLISPWSVSAAPDGTVYIADDAGVWKVGADDRITSVWRNTTPLVFAAVFAAPDGMVYIGTDTLRRVERDGTVVTIAGSGQYKFGGDGGRGVAAILNYPYGLTVDSGGSIYFSDLGNDRIRRIAPDGTISTVAGGGALTADGIRATDARLTLPRVGPIDSAGNLYIFDFLSRVRKISPDGIITTVAGGGTSTEENVPARSAETSVTSGVFDARGNLYINDFRRLRIRRISPDGMISTVFSKPASITGNIGYGGHAIDRDGNVYVAEEFDIQQGRIWKISPSGGLTLIAGGGTQTGSGIPALSARIVNPEALTFDSAGALYVSESDGHRIRRITVSGIIETVAGTGAAGLSGDGGPPDKALLDGPSSVGFDTAGNIYITDSRNNRIRVVTRQPPVLNPLPGQINIAASSGGKAVTWSFAVDASSAAARGSGVPGVAYTVETATPSPWLSVSPRAGVTPGLIEVSADPFELPEGLYTARLVARAPQAAPPVREVVVSLRVGPAAGPRLGIDPDHLSFTYTTRSAPQSTPLTIANEGGGLLTFEVSADTDSRQPWLSLGARNGSATPARPFTVAVTADPRDLPPGTYQGRVTITDGSGNRRLVRATMTISGNPAALLLSKTAVSFVAVEGGGRVPPRRVGIINAGEIPLSLDLQTSTLEGGDWLQVTPSQSVIESGSAASAVSVSVNASRLSAERYYGLITVNAPGAANTPQAVTAVIDVLPRGTNPPAALQPAELLFTAAEGQSPGASEVMVYNLTATPKTFRTAVSGVADWLVVRPRDGTFDPDQPGRIIVQPLTENLSAGTYRAAITVQTSDGRVAAVPVTLVVSPQPATDLKADGRRAADGCTPQELIPVITSLGNDFGVPAGLPVALEVQVTDNCGAPLESGGVVAEFSNGDPPLAFTALQPGRWDATWWTGSAPAPTVTITLSAVTSDLAVRGSRRIGGALASSVESPNVFPGGIVSGAGGDSHVPLAPGALVDIYGDRLSDGTSDGVPPYGAQLAGTTVLIAGQPMPLRYASPGQVQAIVPYGLEVNTRHQVVLKRGLTYARPAAVDVAPAQPAILHSAGQPEIRNAADELVDPARPVGPNEEITIFCLGLGEIDPKLAAGSPVSEPPPAVSETPSVMIGGLPAPVTSASLVPDHIGVYKIRATVPAELSAGTASLQVSAGGQTSVPVMISIR